MGSEILWIFVTVFDDEYGRSIACRYPTDFQSKFTKTQLSRITSLTITREELTNRIISFDAYNYHVIGCPQRIDSKQYKRNTFMFNVAFLLPGELQRHQQHAYEVLVRKLNHSLATHERHSQFITRQLQKERVNVGTANPSIVSPCVDQAPPVTVSETDQPGMSPSASATSIARPATLISHQQLSQPSLYCLDERKLEDIIKDIYTQINATGECSVKVDETGSIYLKLITLSNPQVEVSDEDVPILSHDISVNDLLWDSDLTTQQLVPFVDGQQHVAKIAQLSGVEMRLVKSCLQNLHNFGVIHLLPSFLFSASYLCLPRMRQFMCNPEMQSQCFAYAFLLDSNEQHVSQHAKANGIRNILRFYSLMRPGATLKDIIGNFSDMCKLLDICRVVRFAEIHELIVRIHEYPIFNYGRAVKSEPSFLSIANIDSCIQNDTSKPMLLRSKKMLELLDGLHSTDNVACHFKARILDLEDAMRQDSFIDVIRY